VSSHGALDGAQAVDFAADLIARLEELTRIHHRADAARRSCEDQIAGFERHRFRQMLDLVPDVEHELPGIGVLPLVAQNQSDYGGAKRDLAGNHLRE
jgi:hypothetical protein